MTHIFLYGPSGTGKSTIGRIIARNLSLPFIDLDSVIEANAGISISQIMEQKGESAFRELESSALKTMANEKESVIALGGGTLLHDENRQFAEKHGRVILLRAEIDTLYDQLTEGHGERPLLAGDLRGKLSSMIAKRSEHYQSFPLQVPVDGRPAEENAFQIQTVLGRFHLSAMGKYDVVIGPVENLPCDSAVIVTDEHVAKFHLDKVIGAMGSDTKSVIISVGEEHKNLETVSFLWKSFLEKGLDRKSTVIALGGGVIGDMTGFAASAYMRGIQWICIPTTLLSMVDASVGGKTGIDLPEGKNLVGSFHPPKLVLVDPSLLLTLPEREFRSGMAEVVKHGIISDPGLFELCTRGMDWVKQNLEEIVKRAMAVKIKVIEEDPYEKGVRTALNLGHTVGHAVELVSKFNLRHGEATAIGIVAEARYAERIGVAGPGLSEAIARALSAVGLPVQIPDEMPREEIIRAMRVDKKKNAEVIRFALPVEIGKVELMDVTDLEDVLE